MSILSAFKSSVTTLVLLAAIAVPVHATVTTVGDVDPGGATDPWAVDGILKVGNSGNGTLNITAGGEVTNRHGYIGYSEGSAGEATVTGFSGWTHSGVLSVGQRGSGTLNITDGGEVTNTSVSYDGFIGRYPGSIGEATVTGVGSQWSNSDDLWIGGNDSVAGGTGTLILYDSGLVTVTNITKLWGMGTLNLDGGNLVTGSFDNSEAGTFNFHDGTLTVNGTGGVFNPSTNYFNIDGDAADDSPKLVIANTSNFMASSLKVGVEKRGALTVESGGIISSDYGYLGWSSGSVAEVTVIGIGSQWDNSDYLYVGDHGDAILNIEAGGVLNSGDEAYVGYLQDAMGEATVTGAGSQWNNSGELYVGNSGTGTLNVTDGGVVSNIGGYIGYNAGSTGEATVAGAGSQWNNSMNLAVGASGTGTLNVTDGGLVVVDAPGFIGVYYGSTGEVTVTGTDSQWNNSNNLYVGHEGAGTLNVTGGGLVANSIGIIGVESDSIGEATVTGAGSQWNNSQGLLVGRSGTGTLNIEAGGVVSNTVGYIGSNAGETGEATVTGAGSQWNNSKVLYVGDGGTGTLNIETGGVVSNTVGYIGEESGSTGTATVTGSGAQWNNSKILYVGDGGTGTLNIEAGGVVANTWEGYIGRESTGIGEATVTGAGSQWNNSKILYVGDGGTGTLNVTNGGVVANTNGYIGYNADSTGKATVTGTGSQWNNSGILYVGRSGAGTLNIEAGGVVANTYGYIGYEAGSTGEVTVTGAGSQWNNSHHLFVGNSGIGTLNIEDEGFVSLNGKTSIGAAGMVNLTGGRFEFGQTTLAEFGTVNATSGSMVGDVMITGVNDVASLTALQSSLVELNEVAAVNEGLLYGSAILKSSLDNRAAGELRTTASQWVRFEGDSNINAGEINNFGGEVDFAQDLTNAADGFIGGRDTFFRFGGGLANAGEVGLSVGLHDILGSISNTATGRIMVAGQSTATFYGDVENNGDLFTGQGSQSVFLSDVTGGGNFPGAGIVEFAGAVSPGNSPGTVTFGGDVVMGTTSTTQIELGETSDQLLVDGNASIDGELNVELLGDFTPDHGDQFPVITAGTRDGEFDAIDGIQVAADLTLAPIYDYAGHIGLILIAAAPGDANFDGIVDVADLGILGANFNAADMQWDTGDFNLDSMTDVADLGILGANWSAAQAAGSVAALVPEPTTLSLLAMSVLVVGRMRR